MEKNRSLVIGLSVALLLLGVLFQYTNCAPAEVDFGTQSVSSEGPVTDPPDSVIVPAPPAQSIAVLCAQNSMAEQIVPISFPDPNVTCAWNTDGNLGPRDTYFQGRIEQSAEFSLPAQSTLCGVEFSFATQQFLFDDHFVLVFDDIVLASSYNFMSKFGVLDGLPVYGWEFIKGSNWDTSKEGIFCSGAAKPGEPAEKGSQCTWPRTDTAGTISMRFPKEFIQRIVALNPARTKHRFQMVTIGDNDDRDCEHSPIQFSVRATYTK